MTTIAITGHRGMPRRTELLVDEAIRQEVSRRLGASLVGLTCLADGADTIFSRIVLDSGGSLHIFVPATNYRDELPEDHHATYDALIAQASEVTNLDHSESDSNAHMDASVQMIEQADELFAVWDGKPARGYGGTADVVDVARKRGLPVTVIWPAGSQRD